MFFTTLAQLASRLDPAVLAGLADDLNTPPDLEDEQTVAVIEKAITDGASVIESHLASRLDLAALVAEPSAAASLERINATLALYCLYQRRCLSDAANPLRPARELAEAHLRNVANGTEQLGGEVANEAFSSTEEVEATFSVEALQRF
jgi:phage gp36-like protein